MSIKKPNWQAWLAKLKNVYRFQIVDEKNYDVKLVIELNRLNVIIGFGLALAFFTLINFLFIAYTPLKQYIPGYGSTSGRKEVINMNVRMEELEDKANAQSKYIKNLQDILNDKVVIDEIKTTIKKTSVDTGILTVKSGDEVKFVKEVEKGLKNAELLESVYDTKGSILNNLELTRPVSGAISEKFSSTKPYVVFVAKEKEEVKAILSGNVIFVDETKPNASIIAIQAENQLVYILKNNSKVLKKTGNFVTEGETIAVAGQNKNQYSTILELWYRGHAIDVYKFLK